MCTHSLSYVDSDCLYFLAYTLIRHIARMMMVMRARIRRNACPETGAKKITEDIMLSAVGVLCREKTALKLKKKHSYLRIGKNSIVYTYTLGRNKALR